MGILTLESWGIVFDEWETIPSEFSNSEEYSLFSTKTKTSTQLTIVLKSSDPEDSEENLDSFHSAKKIIRFIKICICTLDGISILYEITPHLFGENNKNSIKMLLT